MRRHSREADELEDVTSPYGIQSHDELEHAVRSSLSKYSSRGESTY